MAIPAIPAAVVSLAPYVLQAVGLIEKYVDVLSRGDAATPEELAALEQQAKDMFQQSQVDRDNAIAALEAAIAAKRAEG